MDYSCICRISLIAIFCLGSLTAHTGCSKSDSGGSGSANGGGASASSIPGEGPADSVKAVGAELDKHWLKTPDGWISQYHTHDAMDKAIDVFVEMKDLKFEVASKDNRSDGDKQNGIEFGTIGSLYASQFRVFAPDYTSREPGPPGKWKDWREPKDPMDFSVFKQNGTWQVGDWEKFKPGGTFQPGNAELSRREFPSGVGIWNGAKPDAHTLATLK